LADIQKPSLLGILDAFTHTGMFLKNMGVISRGFISIINLTIKAVVDGE